MMSSDANVSLVDVRHATRAKAVDVVSAETSDATNTQASHVAPVKAADTGTDVTAANGAHTGTDVTSTKAAHPATTVSPAATAAPGLCARGKKAAGKHCACQNHHCSSCHDILH